jgi:tRNA modification GTPase
VRLLTGRIPAERRASLCSLRWQGEEIDTGLVLIFPASGSFTGENVAELQLHGSNAVIAVMHRILAQIPGLRLAEPGEFTRRAMENGNLDLAQIEGLADLIDSETEAQRKQALRVLSGAIGDKAAQWRQRLVRAAALVAAVIDFSDEDDAPDDVTSEVSDIIDALRAELKQEIQGTRVRERLRDGFEIAIVGEPNVGKSTLLNALAGREAAITSDIAGTTRDVVEVRMDLNGLPVTFLDTAGLRDTDDKIEAIGVDLAMRRAADADLRVFLLGRDGISDHVQVMADDLLVQGKADLQTSAGLAVSGKTGAGLKELIALIEEKLSQRMANSGVATRERHRLAMQQAATALDLAEAALTRGEPRYEIVASELGSAINSMDSLVGRIDVESLLDEIFSSFCIGK